MAWLTYISVMGGFGTPPNLEHPGCSKLSTKTSYDDDEQGLRQVDRQVDRQGVGELLRARSGVRIPRAGAERAPRLDLTITINCYDYQIKHTMTSGFPHDA